MIQSLIFVAVEASSSDEEEGTPEPHKNETKIAQHESSSDDNDSTAAAHAAAIGHSPLAIKQTSTILTTSMMPPLPEDSVAPSPPKLPDDHCPKNEGADAKTVPVLQPKPAEAIDIEDKDSSSVLPIKPSAEGESKIEGSAELGSASAIEGKEPSEATDPAAALQKELPSDQPESVDTDAPAPKANGNVADGEGKTPLVAEAVAPAPRKAIKMEVNRDINLNERDEDENCAIHIAIHARKLEHVKILLEAGASFRMRSDGSLPIHTAISIGSLAAHRQFAYECVVLLHEHGADLSVKDDAVHTPLFLACSSNLPQVVSYILSDEDGLATLNTRADRAGNRPLHAAAKYDTLDNPSLTSKVTSSTEQARTVPHHHPDGSVVSAMHHIPGIAEKHPTVPVSSSAADSAPAHSTEALLTQVLLGTNGIEVDALNVLGQTPLHIACMRRNWPVARLLLQAGASPTIEDRRGLTPGQHAYKRGMPIPNDLVHTLGDAPEKGIIAPLRELIVDPDGSTLLLCHELCTLHRTCPPITRNSAEPPPENVRRLHVLVDPDTGILRSGEFGSLTWKGEARRAAIGDVLKVSWGLFSLIMLSSWNAISPTFLKPSFFLHRARCTSTRMSSA